MIHIYVDGQMTQRHEIKRHYAAEQNTEVADPEHQQLMQLLTEDKKHTAETHKSKSP